MDEILENPPQKPLYKQWWFWLVFIVILGAAFVFVTKMIDNRDKSNQDLKKSDKKASFQNDLDSIVWVPDVMTQPLQAKASKTRINLPGVIDDILPPGSVLNGFGSHVGDHVEGLDHIGIPLKPGVPSKAVGKGKITSVVLQGDEYMITEDLGDGLEVIYGEIKEALVEKNQEVEPLTPIGTPFMLGKDTTGRAASATAELYLNDYNLTSGIYSSNVPGGRAAITVSPYDYLNDTDKAAIIAKYTENIIDPYVKNGIFPPYDWNQTEPYLTNKIVIHTPNKIIGEWFLQKENMVDSDISRLTLTESNNSIYKGNQFHTRSRNERDMTVRCDGSFLVNYLDGNKGTIALDTKGMSDPSACKVLKTYGFFQISEKAFKDGDSKDRAEMKFEWSATPITAFSGNELTYRTRGAQVDDVWERNVTKFNN